MKFLRSKAFLFIFAVTLGVSAGILLVSIFHPVFVSGESMYPTYTDKEVLKGVTIHSPEEIERGDVVVFRKKFYPYIKRVIGLPGERIEFSDGVIYINGEVLDDGFPIIENPGEYLTNGITLEEDEFYCLGDNRNNSADSRIIGPIRFNEISCKVTGKIADLSGIL